MKCGMETHQSGLLIKRSAGKPKPNARTGDAR